MKKQLMVMFMLVGFTILSVFPIQASDTIIYGCYKSNNGQLRVVSDHSECIPPEVPIILNAYIPDQISEITLYVNGSIGIDAPGNGLSPDSPFLTIQYAINSLTHLRSTPEILANILVAAGVYDEAILINKDRIHLKRQDINRPILRNSDPNAQDGDVINIREARDVFIEGFKIENSNRGILALNHASFALKHLEVMNTSNMGVNVTNNSTVLFDDCYIHDCGNHGIGIFFNSSARFYNDVISNNNSGSGIAASDATNLRFESGAIIKTNENGGDGIGSRGALRIVDCTVDANRNSYVGINIGETANIFYNSTVRTLDNNIGIEIAGGGALNVANSATVVSKGNTWAGIAVFGNSGLSLSDHAGVVLEENNIGLLLNYIAVIGNFSERTDPAPALTIRNNVSYGLQAIDGSSVDLGIDGHTIITGNLTDDLALYFGSRASSNLNTIGSIYCDGTALTRGDIACP